MCSHPPHGIIYDNTLCVICALIGSEELGSGDRKVGNGTMLAFAACSVMQWMLGVCLCHKHATV